MLEQLIKFLTVRRWNPPRRRRRRRRAMPASQRNIPSALRGFLRYGSPTDRQRRCMNSWP